MLKSLPTSMALDWAHTAVDVLTTEFPYEAAHRSTSAADVLVDPRVLHPSFHGSYDWHSSAHMQWSLVTLRSILGAERFPAHAEDILDERLAVAALDVEIAYLRSRPTFERPYGWAWAAMLAAAVQDGDAPRSAPWRPGTLRLAETIADLTTQWLSTQRLPVRHGLHQNSAFSLTLMWEAFTALGRTDVVETIRDTALRWYADDRDYPTRFEPSGTDFLSPALTEAALMRHVLGEEFAGWLDLFLPGLGEDRHRGLLDPPPAVDGPDGGLTHLFGLALSRAAQLREIASSLPAASERRATLLAGADRLERSALPTVTDGDFMSTHWLVSFALLARRAAPE